MKVEIEVELGELAKDWEAVAFRVPKSGERYIAAGMVSHATGEGGQMPRLIVRDRKFVWPPALVNVAAICKDRGGPWWCYETLPRRIDGSWRNTNGVAVRLTADMQRLLNITLPPDWDWTAPILNPNKQASEGASDE